MLDERVFTKREFTVSCVERWVLTLSYKLLIGIKKKGQCGHGNTPNQEQYSLTSSAVFLFSGGVEEAGGKAHFLQGFCKRSYNAFNLEEKKQHVCIIGSHISGTLWLLNILCGIEETGERGCQELH